MQIPAFSRMHSEGFLFNSGGLEVGVVFTLSHSRPSATVRDEVAKSHHGAVLTKCDKIKSSLGGGFHRKHLGFVAFCNTRCNSVGVLRGRSNAVEACLDLRVGFSYHVQHFVQAQNLVTWGRCCFHERQCQGSHDTLSKVVPGAAFVSALTRASKCQTGGSLPRNAILALQIFKLGGHSCVLRGRGNPLEMWQ